jgi:ATP-dependent phosphofructokinase / diphosphate-dependent phosphofructokinase
MSIISPSNEPQKIGIFTGGGTAPGLNAVIAGATSVLKQGGHEILGIQEGWGGLLKKKEIIDLTKFTRFELQHLLQEGGTILGTSRTKIEPAQDDQVRRTASEYDIDGVLAIGGDDTLKQGARLDSDSVLKVIGIPKTIDNDVDGTDRTFGFETAYHEATEFIRHMRREARSSRRAAVVEIMGRDAGWITLYAGYIGGAHITLIPEYPFEEEQLLDRIRQIYEENNPQHILIAIAEGYTHNGTTAENDQKKDSFGHKKKEGAAKIVLQSIEKLGIKTQELIPSYLVRAGDPLAQDANFSAELGATAGLLAHERKYGRMVALENGKIIDKPLDTVRGGRTIPWELFYDPETMRKHDLPPQSCEETS